MIVDASTVLCDRYRLQQRIGTGGMGEVWRAEDLVLGRPVAVKLLGEKFAADEAFRERFRNEARHAAALLHDNVAHVYDFNPGDPQTALPPFLVMECVDGEPLSEVLARHRTLDAATTWLIVGLVAGALSAAHAAGIVHRDVKPANLLLRPDGVVKVTDFGIARAVGSAGTTTTGHLIGTPHYLSPEQVAGEPATPASDFYSLGLVAYECLAGHRPFSGDTPVQVALARREQDVPPLPAGAAPAALRDLVMALLARDPAHRPTDGALIAQWANRAAVNLAGRATPPGTADESATSAHTPPATSAHNPPAPAPPTAPIEPYPAEPPIGAATVAATYDGADGSPVTPVEEAAPRAAFVPAAFVPAALRTPRGAGMAVLGALAVAGLIALIVVAALPGGSPRRTGGAASSHSPSSSPHASAPAGVHPVAVRSVTLFHPGGSADDYPQDAHLAADGDAGTAWYTQHYATAAFGNLRPGVGLVFDLGHRVRLATATIRFAVPGVAARVVTADHPGGLSASGPAAAQTSAAPATWHVKLAGRARYVLVWISRLGQNGGGYQAGIAEVRVTGRS